MALARKHSNDEYAIPISRLSDIEKKGMIPSVYRLYSLAVIYRRDIRELMSWYGIDLADVPTDALLVESRKSHRAEGFAAGMLVRMPAVMDPSFDLRRTCNFGRMIERWGIVPLAFLSQFEGRDFTYGFIGTEDLTMYPLLLPGSFVQVDETRNQVIAGAWRSELERPIYFVETRDGVVCCWCALKGDQILLQPHPLSPVAPRQVKHPRDAEVIGQIVGVAMRLDQWSVAERDAREPTALT